MEWFNDRNRRMHAQVLTDGARAAVENADDLDREAAKYDGAVRLDYLREARQRRAEALMIDKAAADGEIAKIAAKVEAKMNRGAAGKRIAARRAAMRVVPGGT